MHLRGYEINRCRYNAAASQGKAIKSHKCTFLRASICKRIWPLMTTGYWKILRTKCSSCGGAVWEKASGCYFFGGGHGACRPWQRIGARILLLHIAKLQRRGAGSAARQAGAVCECLLRARGARSLARHAHTENEKFDKLTSHMCVRAQ
jgi:hypothetical protein